MHPPDAPPMHPRCTPNAPPKHLSSRQSTTKQRFPLVLQLFPLVFGLYPIFAASKLSTAAQSSFRDKMSQQDGQTVLQESEGSATELEVPTIPEGLGGLGQNDSGKLGDANPDTLEWPMTQQYPTPQQQQQQQQPVLVPNDSQTPKAPDDSEAIVAAETSAANGLGPGENWAIQKYAEAKSLNPANVSLQEVKDSPEGLTHWAALDISWSTRAPMGQAFYRYQRKAATTEEKTLYQDLDEPLRKEYRQKWSIKRDYDFTKETKIIKLEFSKEHVDQGTYLTEDLIHDNHQKY